MKITRANDSTGGIYFHTNSSHKESFCHRGKSKLGIGLFIHELLRDPLIIYNKLQLEQYNTSGSCCSKAGQRYPLDKSLSS